MNKKIALLIVLAGLIAAFFVFDLGRFFDLAYLKSQQAEFATYYSNHPVVTILVFAGIYVLVTALSLPGATLLTLLSGALFGLLTGTIVASFASTIGATIAFLASRFIFQDTVQGKFSNQLKTINQGIEKEGAFYLFALRLVPLFPFFAINLIMGITHLKTLTFAWVSQIGMLPGTIAYVFAGTQLASLESISGILSPGVLTAFAVLGLLPMMTKWILAKWRASQEMSRWVKPKQFDNNVIVIGAGSGGLVSAYIAAAIKAEVTLIEKHEMGGDCLNTGCVPSKALIRSAKAVFDAQHGDKYGIGNTQPAVDFEAVMNRVHQVIETIAPHDSVERFTGLGVNVIQGEAKIIDPYHVEVNGQTLSTRNIIVATGARPLVPGIQGLKDIDYLTSDNLWQLKQQPKKLVVLGGGPIGSELSQAFARLGSEVTQVEMAPRIMNREDSDVSEFVAERFEKEGIRVLTDHKAVRIEARGEGGVLIAEHGEQTVEVPFDKLLLALGRQANVSGFGLEELGVTLSPRGTIESDDFLATSIPNIYVCGDVAGPYQFTHTASHQAWFATVNALFGTFKRFAVDYRVIPWATFTDPEVARVGLNETDAVAQNIPYEVTTYGIDDLDRAIADGAAEGWVKVLTPPGKDTILGVTIVGKGAGEMIAEYVLAMKHKLGLNKLLGTIHIYPTMTEANKFAAGNWKRANAPAKVLSWLERFHRFRRGA